MFRFLVIAAIIALGNARAPLGNRIVGGQNVFITQYPYQLALEVKGRHVCGAALIRPNIAVTAAHCVEETHPMGDYTVRAGSSYLQQFGIEGVVQAAHSHPLYVNDELTDYDVAVLILDRSLPLNAQIETIDLIEKGVKLPPPTMAEISGWGSLRVNGERSKQLRAAVVPRISDSDCESYYSERREITKRLMCFGYHQGGKDICTGDFGGPLVVDGQLAGVASFGMGCADIKSPGVYVKISNPDIHDFISKFLEE